MCRVFWSRDDETTPCAAADLVLAAPTVPGGGRAVVGEAGCSRARGVCRRSLIAVSFRRLLVIETGDNGEPPPRPASWLGRDR